MKTCIVVFILFVALNTASAITTRSHSAKIAFVKANACPSTGSHKLPCPGYIIDHVIPLACGGRDSPTNMQWQTVFQSKAKDLFERKDCKKRFRSA